ncbi:ABC transporter permease [Nocardia sp. NBC_01499]|uniref:ABC transporter permease n=1 Tax=Nocardia sp. NBC_01499 TaxID=2903597 RepID=UPI00386BE8A5
MTAATQFPSAAGNREGAVGLSVPAQTLLLTQRVLSRAIREPATIIPNLLISIFFLLIYNGMFGESAAVSEITGGKYINFTLPVAVIMVAISGGAAGFSLLADNASGYMNRQLTMPISRFSMVAAAVVQGAVLTVVLTVVIIAVGFALGLAPATGFAGLLVLLAIAVLWGLGYAGYSVTVSLLTGKPEAAQAFTFLFFPIMFLAPVFLPRSELSGWLRTVAAFNPMTYLMEGMRALLITGWDTTAVARALLAAVLFLAVTMSTTAFAAFRGLQRT